MAIFKFIAVGKNEIKLSENYVASIDTMHVEKVLYVKDELTLIVTKQFAYLVENDIEEIERQLKGVKNGSKK